MVIGILYSLNFFPSPRAAVGEGAQMADEDVVDQHVMETSLPALPHGLFHIHS
jgi:hypothetical protein